MKRPLIIIHMPVALQLMGDLSRIICKHLGKDTRFETEDNGKKLVIYTED